VADDAVVVDDQEACSGRHAVLGERRHHRGSTTGPVSVRRQPRSVPSAVASGRGARSVAERSHRRRCGLPRTPWGRPRWSCARREVDGEKAMPVGMTRRDDESPRAGPRTHFPRRSRPANRPRAGCGNSHYCERSQKCAV
jgi:hypothetical protein